MTKARRHDEGSGAWWWSVAKACRAAVSHVAEVDREDNGAGGVTVVSWDSDGIKADHMELVVFEAVVVWSWDLWSGCVEVQASHYTDKENENESEFFFCLKTITNPHKPDSHTSLFYAGLTALQASFDHIKIQWGIVTKHDILRAKATIPGIEARHRAGL